MLASVVIYALVGGPKFPPGTDAIIEEAIRGDVPELVTGETGYASSDGLDIWYESIAPEGASKGAVLLIMANGGDALIWPRGFVRAFVAEGYRVIRYDHRGTGMSDWVKDWNRRNPYTVADMSNDAAGVLDAAGVQTAHVVGLSLGGMIAQELAIRHPRRVASLALLMTSGDVGDPDLPLFLELPVARDTTAEIPRHGREKNLIKERIAKTIMVVGRDAPDVRELAQAVLYDLRKRRSSMERNSSRSCRRPMACGCTAWVMSSRSRTWRR
jgi:pimeloyl-ACP methyl ester carboxylesterase